MAAPVRMIVTHVDEDGKSKLEERLVDPIHVLDDRNRPVMEGNALWGVADGITPVGPGQSPEAVLAPFFPGPGGHRFVVFAFLPVPTDDTPTMSPDDVAPIPGLLDVFDPDRPGMHRTSTLDYTYVISGRMTLELDTGESVDLGPGDCVVQRGTWHAWRNTGSEPCVVAAVLIGAQAVELEASAS